MTEESNHQWKMTPGGKKDRNYMFSNCKSIELFQAFWNDISNVTKNTSESNDSKTIDNDRIKIEEYCLTNPWAAGKEKMKKVNYLDVKRAKNKHNVRKQAVRKFILKKVGEMKRSIASNVMPEAVAVEPSPWTETICQLQAAHG